MRRQKRLGSLIISVLCMVIGLPQAEAALSCHELFTTSTTQAWDFLLSQRLLADQKTGPLGYHNICGPTCAANVLQAALIMKMKPVHAQPLRLLDQTVRQSKLQPGGMRTDDLYHLVHKLIVENFGRTGWQIEFKLLPSTRSELADTGQAERVPRFSVSDFQSSTRSLQIAVVTRVDHQNHSRGDHAVLIKTSQENRLEFIDPNHPYRQLVGVATKTASVDGTIVPVFEMTQNPGFPYRYFVPVALLSIHF